MYVQYITGQVDAIMYQMYMTGLPADFETWHRSRPPCDFTVILSQLVATLQYS